MANISDAAMETLIGRDGDVPWAQQVLGDALMKVITTTQPAHAVRTGSVATRRNP